MRQARPDPKPRRRDRSREGVAAARAKCKAEGRCRRCGRRPSGHPLDSLNAAHLLGGSYREWKPEAVIPLCGSGTTGCHRLFDESAAVRSEMRPKIQPDEWSYVVSVIGSGAAEARFPHPVERSVENL